MKKIISLLLLAFCCFYLMAQNPAKQVIYTEKAPKPIGPFSQGILSGNTLYLAGQIAINPETGKLDTLTLESEIERIMINLGAVLNAAGMDYHHLVKTTIYITDMKYFKTINTIYGKYFKDNPPARETIQVSALPGNVHVEISGIAIK